MHPEIQKLLRNVNGSPVRINSTRFAYLWDPPLHVNLALKHMLDLVRSPPSGFMIQEVEGRKVTIEIRRLHQ